MTVAEPLIAREYVVSRIPFTVRRVVDWVECDPAGVVYAGHYTEYMSSAMRIFREHGLGEALGVAGDGKDFSTPGKAVSLVFLGPLWPRDVFDMVVYAGEPRKSTIDVLVHAVRVDDGSSVFVGRTTSICVSASDRRQTVPVPDHLRRAIEDYRAVAPAMPDVLRQVEHRA